MEKLLKRFEKSFKEKGFLDIVDDEEFYANEIGSNFEFKKELSVVMKTDVITEYEYYGDEIRTNPILYKANNIEEAWEAIKDDVKEELEYWVKNRSDFSDYNKDRNFKKFLKRVLSKESKIYNY